ncbi:hypothetical protein ACFL2F_02565 [Myxococcota bacterium]
MKPKRRLYAWNVLVWAVVAGLALTNCDDGAGDDRYCCWFEVDAGADIDANVGEEVTLKATVSVSPISYDHCKSELGKVRVWWQQSDDDAPRVTLSSNVTRTVSFTPTESGVYTFCITIEDEICVPRLVPTFDCIYVRVGDYVCSPIANAGEDTTIGTSSGTPQTVTLDGSASLPDYACPETTLTRYTWSVLSQPAGANVTIQTPISVQATAELPVPGIYEFQLEVQDSTGGIGADTVIFTLEQCGTGLLVTAVDARDETPIEGAHVTVVDAAGDSHAVDTNTNGVAGFVALEPGTRQSITVISDETVPPLPGVSGPDRPLYETTTLLDQCAFEVTIPIHKTASGEAGPIGTVVAQVPMSLFNVLPHSWKCAGGCDSDADCVEEYYCELDPTKPCGPNPPSTTGSCTPRSLLPILSLGSPDISGQFRAIMLVPLLEGENFTCQDLNRIFAPPIASRGVWPGNLATDDVFLSELAHSFGLDPWGEPCVSTSGCGSPLEYVCEANPSSGDFECKDKFPFRNIEMDLPAGPDVRLVLVMGIIDVSLEELIPDLFQFIATGQYLYDLPTKLLTSFDLHTLNVCLLQTDVLEGRSVDISNTLLNLRSDDCWNVDFTQAEVTVVGPGGTPLFRVEARTNDRISVEPDYTTIDPTWVNADTRLRSWLPDTASYEVMCDLGGGAVGSCTPPEIHEVNVPPDTECSFPYGLGLAALDVPIGNADLPEGGRVFIGFDFNRCPTSKKLTADFLVPVEAMDGSVMLSATQMYFRNLLRTDLGPFWEIPGFLTAQDRWTVMPATATLPPFTTMPSLDPLPPDAGLSVDVTFVPVDSTVWPDPVWQRVYARAIGLRMPQAVANPMTYDLTETTLTGEALKGVVLSKVDYAAAITWVDPWWRVYVPAGTTNIALPAGDSPFGSGDYVWITPFGAGFGVPFDYNLFPTDVLLGPFSQYSEDSYAVIVP